MPLLQYSKPVNRFRKEVKWTLNKLPMLCMSYHVRKAS